MAGGFPAWLGPSGPCSWACAAYQRLLRLRQNLQTFLDAIAMTKEKIDRCLITPVTNKNQTPTVRSSFYIRHICSLICNRAAAE